MQKTDDPRRIYYEAMTEKVKIQSMIDAERLKRIRGESVDISVLNALESLVIVLLREMQKRYPDYVELRARIEDFENEWRRILHAGMHN